MKILLKYKYLVYSVLLIFGVIFLQGCAVYQPNIVSAVPVSDIVQMSKDHVSSKDIIHDLRRSHSVYLLPADQLAALKNEGVQDSVINYMERTHMDYIRRNQQAEDSYSMWPGYGYGFYGPYFGWPYYGWGWGWGPTVIVHGGEGHEGHEGHEFHGGRR
jgi:hypothetical protein